MTTGNFFDFQAKLRETKAAARAAAPLAPINKSDDKPLTVSQLSAMIDRVLKTNLPERVLVQAEISNCKLHGASGHLYFTLKEQGACIDCVMWRSDAARLKFQPKEGMEVLVRGAVVVYQQRGRYQIQVSNISPLGQGALELAFQQLKAKLESQGLFAPERKKPIPTYPARVVLVTGKDTAAVQDMLKVLRRFPWIKLCIYHVPVQGDGAAEKIAAAIQHLSECRESLGCDVILLARGGGSLEDLWEFNEEVVARAIAASLIPIVTGIGHEVDVSIADLVADHHAHTPTEAAQVITAHWRGAKSDLHAGGERLARAMRNILQETRQRLSAIERHETFRRPLDQVNRLRQVLDDRGRGMQIALGRRLRDLRERVQQTVLRLDAHRPAAIISRLRQSLTEAEGRLRGLTATQMRTRRDTLGDLSSRLIERHPRHTIHLQQQRLQTLHKQLTRAVAAGLSHQQSRLAILQTHLLAIGPEQVLGRGYTITTRKKDGKVVRSAQHLKIGEHIVTRFADGQVESVVEDGQQLKLFDHLR